MGHLADRGLSPVSPRHRFGTDFAHPNEHSPDSGSPMSLKDLLNADAILPSLKVNSKKQALQELSEKAASVSGIAAREIFDALLQRERLGSTGVGNGIAIPHGKLTKAGRIFG